MSLNSQFPEKVPESTRAVGEALLDDDSVHQFLGIHANAIFTEESLTAMYSDRGRGGINPVVLSIVLILQYLEDVPDRQAALMACMRIDWKYATRQELTWEGFDFSTLHYFRQRLRTHQQDLVIFEQVLSYLKEKGFLKRQKQRIDATHMLGVVENLSRLEKVWETIRVALNAILSTDAKWALTQLPPTFVEQHTQKRSDFKLGKEKTAAAMREAGRDGFWLLAQLDSTGATHLQALDEVQLLARVLDEQYTPPGDGQPPETRPGKTVAGDTIASPHEPETRYSQQKQHKHWTGYKLHVTETVGDETGPSIITDIVVRPAIEHDSQVLDDTYDRLEAREALPDDMYGDMGYVNGKTIRKSQQRGIRLRGRIPDQNRKPEGYRLQDFNIDLENRVAICPQGKTATSFNPSQQDDVAFHVRFTTQCAGCPVRELCTGEKRGRSLEISPYHAELSARRAEMQTDAFKEEMKARAPVESRISELVRAHGLRKARYRGQAKLQLQVAFAATAANLKRVARHLAQQMHFLLRAILSSPIVFQQAHVSAPENIHRLTPIWPRYCSSSNIFQQARVSLPAKYRYCLPEPGISCYASLMADPNGQDSATS